MNDPAVPDRIVSAYRSPILDHPGAVDAESDSPDAGVPFHYGDPLGEQRATQSGAVVIDRSHRDVLQITGGATVEEIIRILEESMSVEIVSQEIEKVLFDMQQAGEVAEGENRVWTLI